MNTHNLCCIGHITLDKIVTPKRTLHMPGGTSFYFAHGMSKLDTSDFLLVTALAVSEMDAVEELLHAVGTQVENGFDDTFRHTVFYGFTVCALTEQQADCTEDNGLSGTGFSGNDGKSRLEPDV